MEFHPELLLESSGGELRSGISWEELEMKLHLKFLDWKDG
jgi:hypothetical protein